MGGAASGGAEPGGAASAGGLPGASPQRSPQREPLSPQQLREWLARRTRLRSGTGAGGAGAGGTGAGGTNAGATGAGGAGAGGAGAGGSGAGAAGPGGARTGGTGATGASGAAGTGGAGGAGTAGPGGARTGGAGAGGPGAASPGGAIVALLELEALPLEALALEALELELLVLEVLVLEVLELPELVVLLVLEVLVVLALLVPEVLVLEVLELPELVVLRALELEALELEALELVTWELEDLELGALELEALELEALELEVLTLEALELEALALEALELEVLELEVLELEALCSSDHSPLPAPPPYTEQPVSLTERREPASRPASPVRTVRRARRVPRPRPPPVPGTHTMALRPSSIPQRVPLLSPSASSLPDVPDPESDLVRAASPTVTRLLATVVTDPSFESTVASALVAELVDFAAACRLDYATSLVAESESFCPPSVGGDPDALDIPTPRSYAEAITGPYSSQWQTAMDAEVASWKSTGTYVDEVPPPGANIINGMWIFRVKRPLGSPPVDKARYVARGFSQREGVDFFQTFSPTPKMTTLRGSLHEEIWLCRPPGFTRSFPPGTQWSLRRPVYGLRQTPREWHDTLRTTLAALGFAPSTADPSLFLRTDTSLPPFYILVYVNDLVFATADTEALTLVKSELQKRHTCTDLGELRSYLGL
ncbi:unnamed protein product [Closterium sp. Yama58-4]|nr:unnamed protein product [Closterium sp. Yama58-4]